MPKNKIFIIFSLLIYLVLCSFCFKYFRHGFIGEEVGPFLDFPPKVVCDIGDSGKNKYAIYQNDSAKDFSGTLRNIGPVKLAVCHSEPFFFLGILPNNYMFSIMKNEGSGGFFSEIQKFIFYDNYNLSLLRLHIYLIGAITVLMMWFFLKGFLDIESANIASILLATSLPFINEIHLIRFTDNYIFLFQILIILFLWKYLITQKTKYIYWLSLVMGVATYIKLTVFWMLIALLPIFVYYWFRFKLKLHVFINSCILFWIGCLPLLIYNICSAGASLNGIKVRFLDGVLFSGVNHVAGKIAGNLEFFFKWMLQVFPLELLFLILITSLFISCVVKNKIGSILIKRISFLWYLGFIMLIFIFISAYPGNEAYYLNSYNFFIMPMSATLAYLLKTKEDRLFPSKRIVKFIILVMIAASVFSVSYPLGRPGLFSPPFARLYQNLTRFLEENKIYEPVCFEYKILGVVEYVSKGKVRPLNYYLMFDESKDYSKKTSVLRKVILSNPDKTFIISMSGGHRGEPTINDLIYFSTSNKIPMYIEKIFNDAYGGFVLIKLVDNAVGSKKIQLQEALSILNKTKL